LIVPSATELVIETFNPNLVDEKSAPDFRSLLSIMTAASTSPYGLVSTLLKMAHLILKLGNLKKDFA
jgi:hypothetical protein